MFSKASIFAILAIHFVGLSVAQLPAGSGSFSFSAGTPGAAGSGAGFSASAGAPSAGGFNFGVSGTAPSLPSVSLPSLNGAGGASAGGAAAPAALPATAPATPAAQFTEQDFINYATNVLQNGGEAARQLIATQSNNLQRLLDPTFLKQAIANVQGGASAAAPAAQPGTAPAAQPATAPAAQPATAPAAQPGTVPAAQPGATAAAQPATAPATPAAQFTEQDFINYATRVLLNGGDTARQLIATQYSNLQRLLDPTFFKQAMANVQGGASATAPATQPGTDPAAQPGAVSPIQGTFNQQLDVVLSILKNNAQIAAYIQSLVTGPSRPAQPVQSGYYQQGGYDNQPQDDRDYLFRVLNDATTASATVVDNGIRWGTNTISRGNNYLSGIGRETNRFLHDTLIDGQRAASNSWNAVRNGFDSAFQFGRRQ